LADTIRKFQNLGYLRLNTNGLALEDYTEIIAEKGFTKVKVSIDSLRTGKYTNPSRKSSFDTDSVLRGIRAVKEKAIPIRINMVVGRYNIGEVQEMINFCSENGFELKLFDITYYRDALSWNKNFWKRNYISLLPIAENLEEQFGKPEIAYAVGGFGNPMPVFRANTTSPIRLRISELKAFYRPECINCEDYICQDGFCNITITSDGSIKPCRPEGLDFDLKLTDKDGNLLSDVFLKEKIKRVIDLFRGTQEKERNLEEMLDSWKIV
jgi:molybdenum cofactor biosynthesis enzyme MoaA